MLGKIIRSLSKKKNPYHEEEMKRLESETALKKTKEEEELDKIFAGRVINSKNDEASKDSLNDRLFSSLGEEILDNVTIENGKNERFDRHNRNLNKNIPEIPDFDEHTDILEHEDKYAMPDGFSIPKKLNPIGGAELLVDEDIEKNINLNNYKFQQAVSDEEKRFDAKNADSLKDKKKTNNLQSRTDSKKDDEDETKNYEIVIKDKKKFYKRNGKRITLNDRILTLGEKKALLKRQQNIERKEKIIEKEYNKALKDKETLKNLLEENIQLKKNLMNEEKIIFEKIHELDKKSEELEAQKLRFEKFAEKIVKEKEELHHKEEDLFTRESELNENVSLMNSQIEDILEKQKTMKSIQIELLKKIKDIEAREKEIARNYAHSENTKRKEIEKLEKIDDMHKGLKEKQNIITKRALEIQKGKDIKETIDKLYDSYEQVRKKVKDEYKKLEEVKSMTSSNIATHPTTTEHKIRNSNDGYNATKQSDRVYPNNNYINNPINTSVEQVKRTITNGMTQAEKMDLDASKKSLDTAVEMYNNLPKDISIYMKKGIYNDILILKHEIESRIQ